MKLHIIPSGPIQTIGYLLLEPERGEAVLVDAPEGIWDTVAPMLADAKCSLVELWITHGHWDHTQDAAKIIRNTKALVRAHKADQAMLETPRIMSQYMIPGLEVEAFTADKWMEQGEKFTALGVEVEIRHVPGHCPGNILFYVPSLGSAFVGDALFNGSVGRTDLPAGSFDQLEQSIRTQIYTLPDDTRVFPGHGPDTSVGDEKQSNPYVQA